MLKWILLIVTPILLGCHKSTLTHEALTAVSTTISDDLKDVLFLNDTEGYIVGGNTFDRSLILKTTDGGTTWNTCAIENDPHKVVNSLATYFQKVYAVGIDGKTYVQYPNDNHFVTYQNIWWERMRKLIFLNRNEGLAVTGLNWSIGSILKVDSMGNVLHRDTFNIELNDVIQVNDICLVSGYGVIFYSEDKGSTWKPTNAQGDHFVKLQSIGNKVYAIGYQGSVMVSNDNGIHWEKLRNGSVTYTNKIQCNDLLFISENKGVVVGNDGLLMVTSDGGKTWSYFKNNSKHHFYAISLINDANALIVGENGVIFRLNLNILWT